MQCPKGQWNELSLLILSYAKLSMTTSERNSIVQKGFSLKNQLPALQISYGEQKETSKCNILRHRHRHIKAQRNSGFELNDRAVFAKDVFPKLGWPEIIKVPVFPYSPLQCHIIIHRLNAQNLSSHILLYLPIPVPMKSQHFLEGSTGYSLHISRS